MLDCVSWSQFTIELALELEMSEVRDNSFSQSQRWTITVAALQELTVWRESQVIVCIVGRTLIEITCTVCGSTGGRDFC
jgi:hypothetical protein